MEEKEPHLLRLDVAVLVMLLFLFLSRRYLHVVMLEVFERKARRDLVDRWVLYRRSMASKFSRIGL